MYNGGTGLSCSNPMIQIAGAQRIIEQDPRDIMESGNYTTDVPVMFGANKQEGVSMLTGFMPFKLTKKLDTEIVNI